MAHTNRVLPMLEEDQRLLGMINNLDKRYFEETKLYRVFFYCSALKMAFVSDLHEILTLLSDP